MDRLLKPFKLKHHDFKRLQKYIRNNIGIKMPNEKKDFLESRLKKRLIHLGYDNFSDYCDYLFNYNSQEELNLVNDLVTTHKTDFFREDNHFKFLKNNVFPKLNSKIKSKDLAPLLIWSAGCSSGEEVYTIAMIAQEFQWLHPGFQFKIFGTDISEEVINIAHRGIYSDIQIDGIPDSYRRKFLLRHKDHTKNLFRICPSLRHNVDFSVYNLHQSQKKFIKYINIIFCRNVIIYFQREDQIQILKNLVSHLQSGGFLFLGHAESINYRELHLERIENSIYQKRHK